MFRNNAPKVSPVCLTAAHSDLYQSSSTFFPQVPWSFLSCSLCPLLPQALMLAQTTITQPLLHWGCPSLQLFIPTSLFSTPVFCLSQSNWMDPLNPWYVTREKFNTEVRSFWWHLGPKLNTNQTCVHLFSVMRKIEGLIIQTLWQKLCCSAEHGKLHQIWKAWTNLFTAARNPSALGGFPLVSPRSDLRLSAHTNDGPQQGGARPWI